MTCKSARRSVAHPDRLKPIRIQRNHREPVSARAAEEVHRVTGTAVESASVDGRPALAMC